MFFLNGLVLTPGQCWGIAEGSTAEWRPTSCQDWFRATVVDACPPTPQGFEIAWMGAYCASARVCVLVCMRETSRMCVYAYVHRVCACASVCKCVLHSPGFEHGRSKPWVAHERGVNQEIRVTFGH